MSRFYALLAAVLIVGLLGGTLGFVLMNRTTDAFAQCRTFNIAGADQIGGPFTMTDQNGAQVTDQDVITEPSLIYFGYTQCPDVCPLDNVRNADAVDLLAEKGHSVTPVFISVDHERDTPDVLKDFTFYMHEKMIGLTGTAEQIADVAKTYRVYYKKRDPDNEFFLYDHMTNTYLVLPEQGFVGAFDRALTADQLADQVSCFLDLA